MPTGVALIHPTHGHITPVLGVVAELVARGEAIVFYATQKSRARVEATGAVYRAYPRAYEAFDPTPPTVGLFADMSRLMELSASLAPELAGELSADYLLVDTKSLWGRLAGEMLGIPTITLSVVFAIRPELVPVPALVEMLYGSAPKETLFAGLEGLTRYFESARRFDAAHGTASPGIHGFLGNPQPLNIVFTSREFQIQGDAFGSGYEFVGLSRAPESADIGAVGEPLLYISLGTTFHSAPAFYQACFEAFTGEPWNVLLATASPLPGPAPSNFTIRGFVPQFAVLEKAAAMITHGGMNSVNEGLYCGVPMLVVPQRGDQHLVARRVAELGAGLAIPPQAVTAEALRTSAARLFQELQFRRNAHRLGESLRQAGGASRAAAAILAATQTSESPIDCRHTRQKNPSVIPAM